MVNLKTMLQDWSALSGRVDEALALDSEAREAWIEALPEAQTFKSALRELLAGERDLGGDSPIDELPRLTLGDDESFFPLGAGTQVGPYRLEREIGRGGMGTVWLAERSDGALRRPVALKLPRLDASERLNERMQRERDILASLDHPNIARIYDAGVDARGRPYLALEYIEGKPIDIYCREHALSTSERLRLLLQVARAVSHAHGKLVVHRDLKPANILVTAAGDVRLLDFGIAQLLEGELVRESALTRQLGRVLTPDYASPEQLRGAPLGTASDVYSLAVVAYEVLTDKKPYRLKRPSAAALEEAIVNVDVRPASQAAADPSARRALRGDLDAILNKAMKKEAAERYESIEAFARDIERHLERQPVKARPDAPWYRVRRFVDRNAVAVAAAAAVFVALVGGTGVALWQARAARLEAARAEQVKDFALSIVNGADTESGANRATTAIELLQAAKVRVEGELADSPETAVELMTAVGVGLQSQGRSQEAAEVLKAARERATAALGPGHPRTLAASTAYGTALLGLDRPKDSIAVLTATVDEATRRGDVPARIAALRELSSSQLAAAEGPAGLASARAAVDALVSLGAKVRPLEAFYAWAQLANAMNVAQDPGLAEAAQKALGFARQVYGNRLTDNVLGARLLLARGLQAQGDNRAALAELEAIYADAVRFLGAEHPRLEATANFLGSARAESGDLEAAVAAFRVALTAGERNPEGTGGNRGIGHFVLGRALVGERRDAEALPHFEESVRLLAAAVGPDTVFTLRSRSAAAFALARLGRLEEADRAFVALAAAPWSGPEKAMHEGRLAVLRDLQGRHAEAVTMAQASADALHTNPSRNVRAAAAATLGRVLLHAGRPDDAVVPLQEATRLWSETQVRATPDRSDAEADLKQARRETPVAGTKPTS